MRYHTNPPWLRHHMAALSTALTLYEGNPQMTAHKESVIGGALIVVNIHMLVNKQSSWWCETSYRAKHLPIIEVLTELVMWNVSTRIQCHSNKHVSLNGLIMSWILVCGLFLAKHLHKAIIDGETGNHLFEIHNTSVQVWHEVLTEWLVVTPTILWSYGSTETLGPFY